MEFIAQKARAYVDWSKQPLVRHDKVGIAAGRTRCLRPPRRLHACERACFVRVRGAGGRESASPTPPRATAPRRSRSQHDDAGDVDASHRRLYAALAAEFLGLLLFQLYGGEVSPRQACWAPR